MAEIQKDTLGSREDTARFFDLVSLFGTQAMMALGKLANPGTGKAEKHLDAARLFIDLLEMVERKTAGNLTPDETKVLKATLTDLRLMFVEEAKSPAPVATPQAETGEPQPEDKGQQPAGSEPQAANENPQATDESKVKFRKKYE